jgi:hypothetical protein
MIDLIVAFLLAILPPCPTDEAIGTCGWDAQRQGDGEGTSFVVVADQWIPLY